MMLAAMTPAFAALSALLAVAVIFRTLAPLAANPLNRAVAIPVKAVEHAIGDNVDFFLGYSSITIGIQELKGADHAVTGAFHELGLELLEADFTIAVGIGSGKFLAPDFFDLGLGDHAILVGIEALEQALGALFVATATMSPAPATALILMRHLLALGLLYLLPPVPARSSALSERRQAGRQRGSRDARSQSGNCNLLERFHSNNSLVRR